MLLLPVEMCFHAISKKFIRPFQLYVYLKCSCSGIRKIEKDDLKLIAEAIGLKSPRAVKNNLKILLRENWIGYDSKTNNYFIRGFEKVRTICKFKSRTGAEFVDKDIKRFKAFIAGAVIGYLVNSQRRRKWESERYKGSSKHLSRNPSSHLPVANKGLAIILEIAPSTASILKKIAAKAGYILVEKGFTKTGVNIKYKNVFKKSNPAIAHRVRVIKKELVLQDTDKVLPTLTFRRRKKIESLIRGS